MVYVSDKKIQLECFSSQGTGDLYIQAFCQGIFSIQTYIQICDCVKVIPTASATRNGGATGRMDNIYTIPSSLSDFEITGKMKSTDGRWAGLALSTNGTDTYINNFYEYGDHLRVLGVDTREIYASWYHSSGSPCDEGNPTGLYLNPNVDCNFKITWVNRVLEVYINDTNIFSSTWTLQTTPLNFNFIIFNINQTVTVTDVQIKPL